MRGPADIACAASAALVLTTILVVGACQEHIPAYALVPDDAAGDGESDASADANVGDGDGDATDCDAAAEARATGD